MSSLHYSVLDMDKSWIKWSRKTDEYKDGLNKFLDFAFEQQSIEGRIICPCHSFRFKKWLTRVEAYDHLTQKQFPAEYTKWVWHGECNEAETSSSREHVMETSQNIGHQNLVEDIINDAFGFGNLHDDNEPNSCHEDTSNIDELLGERMDEASTKFYELLNDGNQELYEGCTKYSKLSFLIKLYHIKCLCGMTDKAMTMILELLKDAFEHAKIPSFFNEAKKSITKVGLHACLNDCMLYRGMIRIGKHVKDVRNLDGKNKLYKTKRNNLQKFVLTIHLNKGYKGCLLLLRQLSI